MTSPDPPPGFKPHFRKSGFTAPWEPLYSKVTAEKIVIGLYLREPHCNSRGMVHGGLIAALCDNAMGLSCVQVLKGEGRDVAGLVTINLNTDFISAARLGQWMTVDTTITSVGGSLAFATALVEAEDQLIAKASATFKVRKKA